MSITIISALPKTGASAKTDAGPASSAKAASDPADAAVDFASLLGGQLVAATPAPIAAEAENDETTNAQDAKGGEDPAALLATLGIVASPALAASPAASAAKDAPPATPEGLGEIARLPAKAIDDAALKAAAAPAAAELSAAAANGAETSATARFDPAIIAANAARNAPEKVESARHSLNALEAPTTASINASAATAPAHRASELTVPTAVRDPHWAADFGQKIVWLANNDKQFAQLTLNPAQMGPIEIAMSLDKGSASASFFSANAEVREAIETALPKLREMFASAGIELGQTNVSAESFRQAQADDYRSARSSRSPDDKAILVADSAAALPSRPLAGARGNAMVDIFA